jgi:hypothetical protein
MYKSITFKIGDIDTNSVVAYKVLPNGNEVELKHCGNKNAVQDKKHKSLCVLDVKTKPKKLFSISFICVGTHGTDFEPLTVFITARRMNSSELLRSQSFILIGSRDENRIREFAEAKRARTAAQSVPPALPTLPTQPTNLQIDPRANPPPPTRNELGALKLPADQGNPADSAESLETQDELVLDIDPSEINQNPYEDFTHSRFDN